MELRSFPKLFALGTRHAQGIFDGPVEITEKLDGSQFAFGKLGDEFVLRSKGARIYPGSEDKLFKPVVAHVLAVQDKIPDGYSFWGETLCRPKHNCIAYERIPMNHFAIFGVADGNGNMLEYDEMTEWATILDVDVVPLLHEGMATPEMCLELVKAGPSYLGGMREGVVVKNYAKRIVFGDMELPLVGAKFVSEAFKEVHRENWGKDHAGKGKLEVFMESFRATARWHKAIMRFKEEGRLAGEPRDIGELVKSIQNDVFEEEADNIKDALFSMFKKDIARNAVAGFPEWYKEQIATGQVQ